MSYSAMWKDMFDDLLCDRLSLTVILNTSYALFLWLAYQSCCCAYSLTVKVVH